MVQVIQGQRDLREAGVGQLAEALGGTIGNRLNNYFINRSLDSVLKDKSLSNSSTSEKMGRLEEALRPYGQKGQQILQNRMMIEQQEQNEKEQGILGKIVSGEKVSPDEMSKLSSQNQLRVFDIQKRKEAGRSVYDSLLKAGYPEETAKLWQNQMENSPTGGQSDIIKNVNDLIRRSKTGKGLGGDQQTKEESKPNIEIPGVDLGSLQLDFPDLPDKLAVRHLHNHECSLLVSDLPFSIQLPSCRIMLYLKYRLW